MRSTVCTFSTAFCLFAIRSATATAQELPAAPLPVTVQPADPPPSEPLPAPGLLAPVQTPLPVYPPVPFSPYPDGVGPVLREDPWLDRPESCWFGAIEVDIVGVHLSNRLIGAVGSPSFSDFVQLPTAELDGTGAPRVELGYRLPSGQGEILLAYHSLLTEGVGPMPGFDLDGSDGVVWSRLNVNTFDVDYASSPHCLGSHWDMRWKAGVRIGGVFFDSLATAEFREQRASNSFVGAGPHLGIDLSRRLGVPGLQLCSRLEAAPLIGEVRQSFEEQFVSGSTLFGAASRASRAQVVPDVYFQLGLTWTPGGNYRSLHVSGGYEIESWWEVGHLGSSRADLTAQGIFFRAEWDF